MSRIVEPLSEAECVAFVAAARARIGTPFRHRGRSEHRLDCLGLLVVALAAVGRQCDDRRKYGRAPEQDRLREALAAHFGPAITDEPRPGDVAVMRWVDRPQHVAIFGDYLHGGLSVIHSDGSFGAVTEHIFAEPWCSRVREIFRP